MHERYEAAKRMGVLDNIQAEVKRRVGALLAERPELAYERESTLKGVGVGTVAGHLGGYCHAAAAYPIIEGWADELLPPKDAVTDADRDECGKLGRLVAASMLAKRGLGPFADPAEGRED